MPTTYPAKQGENDGAPSLKKGHKELLERIRRRFNYHVESWRDIRAEAALDVRATSTAGPWDPTERDQRQKDKRPCIHLDQLGQYINNLVNEVRMNPIAIKVSPAGEGTNDKTAELTGNRIRQLEYESNAVEA